jgi:predicted  nucleic acid-binding Zn-ribbon protein
MQLRCTYCQTMFAISREDMLAGLEHMEENKQIYYDAHCPKCRRANRVEQARMERFFPDWKKAIKTMEKESSQVETAAEEPVARSVSVKAAAALRTATKPAKEMSPKPKMKPNVESAKKPAAKTPYPKGTSAGPKKK